MVAERCTGGRQCVRYGTLYFNTFLRFLQIFQMAVDRGVQVVVRASGIVPRVSPLPFVSYRSFRWLYREVYRWTSMRQVWYPVFHHFPLFLSDLSDGCIEKCTGGRQCVRCGTLCFPTCKDPRPSLCDDCVVTCQCPDEKPIWNGHKCVTHCK